MSAHEHLSPVQFPISNLLPGDGPTWPSVREDVETNHPTVMAALREDIGKKGIQTPLIVYPDGEHHRVANGHHRLLAASDLGHTTVPVEVHPSHVEAYEAVATPSHYWDPETRKHYVDEHGEGQPRY